MSIAKKILIISLGVVFLASCSNLGYSSAIAECQELVKDRLRAPGSAKFEKIQVNEKDDSYFEIVGVVDSENGFGALLRANFKCSGYDKSGVKLLNLFENE
jgi:hypothetical protein